MNARPAIALDADDVEDFRAVVAQWQALGGKSARYAGMIAERLDGLPDRRRAWRDEAVIALAARELGSDRRKAREVAKKLWRYETTPTRWHAEQKMQAPPLVYGEEGRLLHLIMKADGAVGFEAIRKILADARNAGDSVGNGSALSITHRRAHAANQAKRGERRVTDQIRPAEIEALVALARRPEALKAVEDQHVRLVSERQARLARIRALDAQAEKDWPAGQRAIAKAIEARDKVERALRDANAALNQANAEAFNASMTYTRERQAAEAALLASADLPTINAWKSELLNELTALGRPSVIVTSQTVTRSEVTRKEIRNGFSNIKSIHARMAAVRASYEAADLLKLIGDQRTLPAIIDGLRASWPQVDHNPQSPRATQS